MLMPPSQVSEHFFAIRDKDGIEAATAWFYALCRNSNYIRTAQIAKNIRYSAPSPYGEVEVLHTPHASYAWRMWAMPGG